MNRSTKALALSDFTLLRSSFASWRETGNWILVRLRLTAKQKIFATFASLREIWDSNGDWYVPRSIPLATFLK
jgi:hypothetical protein